MNPRPPPHLLKTFDKELVDLIIEILDRAYQIVSKSHDPTLGFNSQTFGYNLYFVAVHQAVEELKKRQLKRIQVLSERPVFRLRVDDLWELALHKVGNSVADDIWEKFPSTDSSALVEMVTQPSLFSRVPTMPQSFDHATKAVIAHLGNPRHGLSAVYACIPSRYAPIQDKEGEGRIIEWGVAHPLLLRKDQGGHGDDTDVPLPSGPTDSTPPTTAVDETPLAGEPLAPDEQIDDIDLPLKKPAKRDDDRTE